MYARKVDDRELNFAVSGLLWNRSFVMIDEETETLWSHILGTAQRGPLKGQQLKTIPSVLTDWRTWLKANPETSAVLLPRTSRHFNNSVYKKRLDQYVLGIATFKDSKAWSFKTLAKKTTLNDTWRDEPVVVVFNKQSGTARLFKRTVGEQTLSFRVRERKWIDEETLSRWDPITGQATAGLMKGKYLTPLPAITSFRKAWLTFHPNSPIR